MTTIDKKEFYSALLAYNEDEQYYRMLYEQEQMHPETFDAFVKTLDLTYLEQHKIYVPAIHGTWFVYGTESSFFAPYDGNIACTKHYRYTPEFIHEHEYYEILYVYSGQCTNTIQGIRQKLATGDLLIIPPKTKHSIGVFDDSLILNIILKTSTFHETFSDLFAGRNALSQFFFHILYGQTENNYLLFCTGEDSLIRSLIEDLYIEYQTRDKYYISLMNSCFLTLFGQLMRRHESHMESHINTACPQTAVLDILHYLQDHYTDITLTAAADHFGFSAPYFSKLLKDHTGISFIQLIQTMKLEKAAHLLANTDLSIQTICQTTGYQNPEHFNRIFKKRYQIPPGDYRRQYQIQL